MKSTNTVVLSYVVKEYNQKMMEKKKAAAPPPPAPAPAVAKETPKPKEDKEKDKNTKVIKQVDFKDPPATSPASPNIAPVTKKSDNSCCTLI